MDDAKNRDHNGGPSAGAINGSSDVSDGFPSRVDEAFEELDSGRIIERIWERDHTVWRPEPTEITDRLGWLQVAETMTGELPAVETFAEEARSEQVRDVVLLGMGGSSLGAEALVQALRHETRARLRILDSTVPAWVDRVAREVDIPSTLFLVASKSGTTTEVQALFDFFWALASETTREPGKHFAAITDPGTPLAALGRERGFRRVWLNPPDIGGRFSALSLFGLLPAALAGIDVRRLQERAVAAQRSCGPGVSPGANPAVRLGAFLGAGARSGRDKATLLCPPELASFGLWAEQLLAESTGKDGTGILPVTGEPWGEPADYGPDRLFVALELAGDESVGALAGRLARAGHPVLDLPLPDPWDIGGQLFVWQLATAIAGHLLGIHPFDQPDVQAAKDRTRELLNQFEREGRLPEEAAGADLVGEIRREPPTYLALLAFLDSSPELEAAVDELRRAALQRHRLPSTFGYGPRYLHSTGQLHKGGPPGGLHVQLVPRRQPQLPIPGQGYGFETLSAAQAAGDLQALATAGRRAVRMALDPDSAADELSRLAREL